MGRLFASLAGVAEARVRGAVRRARARAVLLGLCLLMAVLAAGFGLAAATVALADEIGVVPALLVMAGLALLGVLILLVMLGADARKARRIAEQRAGLDRQLAAAALRSAGSGRPSRGALGLMLVAAGAMLVLSRRDED